MWFQFKKKWYHPFSVTVKMLNEAELQCAHCVIGFNFWICFYSFLHNMYSSNQLGWNFVKSKLVLYCRVTDYVACILLNRNQSNMAFDSRLHGKGNFEIQTRCYSFDSHSNRKTWSWKHYWTENSPSVLLMWIQWRKSALFFINGSQANLRNALNDKPAMLFIDFAIYDRL